MSATSTTTVPLKAWNLSHVEHARGSFSGHLGTWTEITTTGSRFLFHETARDEWSVYASDPTRNYRVQIDIHRNKISLATPKHNNDKFVDYYDILPESRKDVIPTKGWTLCYVAHSGGVWREHAPQRWVERSFSNAKFKADFVEQSRDEWSVYMFDKSRDYPFLSRPTP